jgi:hypothetical protein
MTEPDPGRDSQNELLLPNFYGPQITGITIQHPDQQLIELTKSEGYWSLRKPRLSRANPDIVESALQKIEECRIIDKLEQVDTSILEFGLSEKRAILLTFRYESTEIKLRVGQKSADGQGLYLLYENQILITDDTPLLLATDFDKLRWKQVFSFDVKKVTALSITQNNGLLLDVIRNNSGIWTLQSGEIQLRANHARIDDTLSELLSMEVDDFLTESSQTSEIQVVIKLQTEKPTATHTLQLNQISDDKLEGFYEEQKILFTTGTQWLDLFFEENDEGFRAVSLLDFNLYNVLNFTLREGSKSVRLRKSSNRWLYPTNDGRQNEIPRDSVETFLLSIATTPVTDFLTKEQFNVHNNSALPNKEITLGIHSNQTLEIQFPADFNTNPQVFIPSLQEGYHLDTTETESLYQQFQDILHCAD